MLFSYILLLSIIAIQSQTSSSSNVTNITSNSINSTLLNTTISPSTNTTLNNNTALNTTRTNTTGLNTTGTNTTGTNAIGLNTTGMNTTGTNTTVVNTTNTNGTNTANLNTTATNTTRSNTNGVNNMINNTNTTNNTVINSVTNTTGMNMNMSNTINTSGTLMPSTSTHVHPIDANPTLFNMTNMTIGSMMNMKWSNGTCNITHECINSGTGRDLTTTCLKNETCVDCVCTTSCLLYYCYNCNLLQLTTKDFYQTTPNDIFSRCSVQVCTRCFSVYNYNNTTYVPDTTYLYPEWNNSTKAVDFSSYVSKAFDRTVKRAKRSYKRNICFDSRVPDYFGDYDVNSEEYQSDCKDLVTDFGQMYMPYQCNDWICNFQGKCSFNNNSDNSTVSVMCSCNPGYSGRKCIYPDRDYSYALNWTINVGRWLEVVTKNFTVKVTDDDIFYNIQTIISSLLSFVKTVDTSDISTITRVFGNLMNVLFSADVQYKQEYTDSILLLISYTFEDPEPLIGLDPSILLSTFNAPSGTNNTGYGFYRSMVNTLQDILIGLANSTSARNVRLLESNFLRLLQTQNPSSPLLNMANPSVVIPKAISLLMPADTSFSMTFIRDPKYYLKENQVAIQSQVVTLLAYSSNNTKNFYKYPQTNDKVKITIPWARVPLTVSNGTYLQNCKVYSFDGNQWKVENTCNIEPNTDSMNAVISCASFNTFGINCGSPSIVTVVKKASGSSFFFSYLILFLLGFLMI